MQIIIEKAQVEAAKKLIPLLGKVNTDVQIQHEIVSVGPPTAPVDRGDHGIIKFIAENDEQALRIHMDGLIHSADREGVVCNVSHETLERVWDGASEKGVATSDIVLRVTNDSCIFTSCDGKMKSVIKRVIGAPKSGWINFIGADGVLISPHQHRAILKTALNIMEKSSSSKPALTTLHVRTRDDIESPHVLHYAAMGEAMGFVTHENIAMAGEVPLLPVGQRLSIPYAAVETWKKCLDMKFFKIWGAGIQVESEDIRSQESVKDSMVVQSDANREKVSVQIEMRAQSMGKFDAFKLLAQHTKAYATTWELNRRELLQSVTQVLAIRETDVDLIFQDKKRNDAQEGTLLIRADAKDELQETQFNQELEVLVGGKKKEQALMLDPKLLSSILSRIDTEKVVLGYTQAEAGQVQRGLCIWSGQNHTDDMFILMPRIRPVLRNDAKSRGNE